MTYNDEFVSCGVIYIPSFMKICADTQAMFSVSLSNARSDHVGIIDCKDL
jgi:hypothetical protein